MEEKTKNEILKNKLNHYISDAYTKEEASEVLKMAKERSNDRLLEEYADAVWDESGMTLSPTRLEHDRLKQEGAGLLRSIRKEKRFNPWRAVFRVAACILLLITAGFGVKKSVSWWNHQHMTYTEVITATGEKRSVLLPDGTTVSLNACSRLRYPDRFCGLERRVELVGQGYFEVKKDPEHTFIVKTGSFDVKVLGTAFDVKAYPTDELVSVSVSSGKVQVDLPEAMMRLKANEQLVVNTRLYELNKRRENISVAGWINGELSFRATPIRDVAKDLERIYGCRIRFQEGKEFNNLITGEHDKGSLDSVLANIEFVSGIRHKKENGYILFCK